MRRLDQLRDWIVEIRACLAEKREGNAERRGQVRKMLDELSGAHPCEQATAARKAFDNAHVSAAALNDFSAKVDALEAVLPEASKGDDCDCVGDSPRYPGDMPTIRDRVSLVEKRIDDLLNKDGLVTRDDFRRLAECHKELCGYVRHLADATIGSRL